MATRIRAILEAVDLATPTIKRVDRALTGLGVVAAAVGAYAIGRQLVQGIASSVKAAAEAEKVNARLAQAIANSGQSVATVLPHLDAQAKALQQITAADDEAIKSGQALLISLGRLRGEGLEKATKAALDFAAGTGTELNASFTLLAKAAAGNTSALSRYGIVLDESIPKGDRFNAVLELMAQRFGGQAEAQAKTLSGQIDLLGQNVDNLREAIGDQLLPVGVAFLREFLNPLIAEFTGAAEGSSNLRTAVISLTRSMIPMLESIERTVHAASELSKIKRPSAFDYLKNPAKFMDELADAALQAKFALGDEATPAADRLRKALEEIEAGTYEASAGGKTLATTFGGDVKTAFEQAEESLDAFLRAQRLQRSYRSLFTLDPATIEKSKQGFASFDLFINAAFRQMSQYAEKVIETLKTIETVSLDQAISAFVDVGFVKMEESLAKSNAKLEDFDTTMNRTLRGAGVNAAEAFGNSLVDAIESGEFAFRDFARSTLDMFARMITQALVWRAVLGIAGGVAGGGGAAWQSSAGAGLAAPISAPVGAMSGPIIVNAPLTVAAGVNRSELAGILVEHRQNTMRAVADGVRRGGRYRAAFAS